MPRSPVHSRSAHGRDRAARPARHGRCRAGPDRKEKGEAEQVGYRFWGLVKVVHRLAVQDREAEAGLAREMFQTAQWGRASEAAASLAQMATRGAKGDPALAALRT
jgi:hypothetical protein